MYGSRRVKPSSTVLDLGVNIDGQLTMADHVAALRRSCLFQLRQLRMVRSSLTLKAAKTLVHAFVSSRLDYCNSLLYGIGDGLLTKLQTVQNAAARVVKETRIRSLLFCQVLTNMIRLSIKLLASHHYVCIINV